MDTYTEMMNALNDALAELKDMKQAGYDRATRQRDYEVAVAKRELQLHDQDRLPVSLIKNQAKGDEKVASMKFAYECSNVNYETSREAIMLLKKKHDDLRMMFDLELNQLKGER